MKYPSLKAVVYVETGVAAWSATGRDKVSELIDSELWENVQRSMFQTEKITLFFSVRTSVMQLLEC